MDCARVIRGIASIAKLVTPTSASDLASSGLVSGSRKPIRTWPRFRRPTSSAVGGVTLRTTSAAQMSSPTFAPASVYSSSPCDAPSPASGSTTTSISLAVSALTTSGTSATRRSPSAVSFGTPIFIGGRLTLRHQRRPQKSPPDHGRGNLVGFGIRPLRQRGRIECLVPAHEEAHAKDLRVTHAIEVGVLVVNRDPAETAAAAVPGVKEDQPLRELTGLGDLEAIVAIEGPEPVPEPLAHRGLAFVDAASDRLRRDHERHVVRIQVHCPPEISLVRGGELPEDDVDV